MVRMVPVDPQHPHGTTNRLDMHFKTVEFRFPTYLPNGSEHVISLRCLRSLSLDV